MQHADHVERYPGTLAELANELGNLRYDALATFLAALAEKLEGDSLQDAARGRKKLAAELRLFGNFGIPRGRQLEIHRQHHGGVEPRINRTQARESLDQEARSYQ